MGIRTDLPTWAWAAISGGKVWASSDLDSYGQLESVVKLLKITKRRSLATTGYFTKPLPTLFSIARDFGSQYSPEARIVPHHDDPLPRSPAHAIWQEFGKEKVLGIAIFDSGESYTSARCFFLAAFKRKWN